MFLKRQKKNFTITILFFFITTLSSFVYLISDQNNKNYYAEYSILYDKAFVDQTFYTLNIATQLPEPDYKRGEASYYNCISKENCLKVIGELKKKINDINNKLWNVTQNFMRDYDIDTIGDENNIKKITNEGITKSNIYSSSAYRYILRLEYLNQLEKPKIVMVNYQIIDNTVNNLFTKFYKYAMVSFILSLVLFSTLYFFSTVRNK